MNSPLPSAPPANVSELLHVLDETTPGLPRRLRQCADFTRQHLHLIAVSTVSELAEAAGVAPSVYVRFCKAMGFSGFSQMQGIFQAQIQTFRPDYEKRLITLQEDGAKDTRRILADFVEAGHKSLMALENTLTSDSIDRVARAMGSARVTHLIGLRRAFAVVSNMAYLLDRFGVPANLHFSAGMLSGRGAILPGDLVFVVTFAPFSQEAIALAAEAKERGATVIGLSDARNCPVAPHAKEMLLAPEEEVGGFRALNAAIALTTALCVAAMAARGAQDPGPRGADLEQKFH